MNEELKIKKNEIIKSISDDLIGVSQDLLLCTVTI